MKQCPHEDELVRLSRGESRASLVAEHLATCASCRENVETIAALRLEAEHLIDRAAVPPAARILFRARLRQRALQRRRAAWPIRLMEHAAALIAVAVAGVLLRAAAIPGAESRLSNELAWILAGVLACVTAVVTGLWLRASRQRR